MKIQDSPAARKEAEKVFGTPTPADRPPESEKINPKFPPDKYLYINGKLARDRHGNEILRPEAKSKPGRKLDAPPEPQRIYGQESENSKAIADQIVGSLSLTLNAITGYMPDEESRKALTGQFSRYIYFRSLDGVLPPEFVLAVSVAMFVQPALQTEKAKKILARFSRKEDPKTLNASAAAAVKPASVPDYTPFHQI